MGGLEGISMETKRKHTILVVDDDREMATSYSELLGHKFGIRITESGMRAVDTVHADANIDIVVLDHKIPDLSGIEVLKKIKEIKPDLPVLIVTGYGDEELAVKSFRYGAHDYIKKPFCFNELAEKIDFYLSAERNNKKAGSLPPAESAEEARINYAVIDHGNSYKIQKVMRFIHDNFMEEEATLDVAADKACMSKRHFCRVFKKAIGMTYQNYLNRCRIKKAKEMLIAKHSITEVAFAVGYSDITQFGRVFKRVVGCTPSQYRFDRSSIVFDNQP